MVVPAREPASLGTSHEPARPYNRRVGQTLLSYEVNQSVVLRWGRREGKRRLGAACLLSSVMDEPHECTLTVIEIYRLTTAATGCRLPLLPARAKEPIPVQLPKYSEPSPFRTSQGAHYEESTFRWSRRGSGGRSHGRVGVVTCFK